MKTVAKLTGLVVMLVAIAGVWTAFAEDHAVKVAQKEGIGSYLTDMRGMTLYNFKKDTPGKSACEGPCVDNWPLYYREKVDGMDGLSASDFGTITRPDGKMQTTYKGMPLYHFIKDVKPGDTNGQGFKGLWSVTKP